MILAGHAADENRKKKRSEKNKYAYEVDISQALRLSRKYMRDTSGKRIDITKLMLCCLHAVKEKFRKFDRPLRGISAIRFSYR